MAVRSLFRLFVVLMLLVGVVVSTAATGAAADDPPDLELDTAGSDGDTGAAPVLDRRGRGTYVVQFGGPILRTQTDALRRRGGDLLGYLPDFAYKVRMTPAQADAAADVDGVVAVAAYRTADKLAPDLAAEGVYRIRLERGADPAATRAALTAAGAQIIAEDRKVIAVLSDRATLESVAAVADVAWVENDLIRETHGDYAGGVIMGADAAHAAGYDGSTQTVAIADTGLGGGSASTAHTDIPAGRVANLFNWQGPDSTGCYRVLGDGAQDPASGHGTHVAVTAVGDGGAGGVAKGTAPAARLVFQAVEDWVDFRSVCALSYADGYYLIGLPNDLRSLFQQAFDAGARIHSNSWGSNSAGAYTTDSQAVDDFMWANKSMLVTTSAGNAGRDGNADGVVDLGTVGSPGTAKNVLTVGASENDRNGDYQCQTGLGNGCPASGQNIVMTYGQMWPSTFPAQPLFGDQVARNAQQMAGFSSRGPTSDGRIKPDLVAPGTWVLGGFSDLYQQGFDVSVNPRSGVSQSNGWGRPFNVFYKYNGGTSMSNPLVAGAAALVRDYYQKAHSHSASAALTKATLVNSAVDLLDENNDGANDNDFPIPNQHEGWGRVNVADAVDGGAVFVDQSPGVTTGAGSTTTYTVAGGSPFKATLAWTDYPSTPAAAVNLVNDLDLTVTSPTGTVYRGNVFSGGWSATGGSADRRNIIENVYVPSAAAGTWTVTVSGFNVPFGPQPFALVVDGAGSEEPPPNLPPSASFTSSCVDLTCSFTDTSTDSDGSIVSRSWSFGDGGSSSATNPSRTYAAGGTYTVSLTVVDDDGAPDTESAQVTVSTAPPNLPPSASFTSSCVDLTCSFTDTSTDSDGSIVSRSWSFGDGGSSSATNPSRTYAAGGTYTVSLTVVDDDGAPDTDTAQVTVTASTGGGTTMRIGDLDGVAVGGRPWTALVTNRVVSNLGTPVAGATVSGEWRGGATSSCVTNATGSCDVSTTTGKVAMIWTVVSVTHPTLSYTPAQNGDPDGDSDGTEIWLYRP